MVSLTGGPRPFDREGFRMEEETNWQRAELLVAAGIARNRHTVYRLGPPSPVTSREFNRAVIRLRTNARPAARVPRRQRDARAGSAMPLLTLHTTGDGQVPIDQAAHPPARASTPPAGTGCSCSACSATRGTAGSRATEWEAALEALVRWVEHGVRPKGNDVRSAPERPPPAVRADPASGHPGGGRGPAARGGASCCTASFKLDGAPFDARWLGAVVLRRRTGHAVPADAAAGPARSRLRSR